MLELRNVTKEYRSRHAPSVKALDDVSLTLPAQGMVFILGRSGCGKTTLVNLLSGLDTPTSGEILIHGRSGKAYSARQYDQYRSQQIGLVFQEYNLIQDFTVRENIALAMEFQGKAVDTEHIGSLLDLVGLNNLADRKPQELSGGQQQRVAIARALAKDPLVILADEPTGALDSTTGRQIMDILKAVSAQKLVVVVSHDRELAESYADRCIELADGRVIRDTQPGEQAKIIQTQQPQTRSNAALSLRTALKIGKNCIRSKKLRFTATVLLSVLAFSFLGLSDVLGDYNKQTALVDSLYASDLGYTAVQKSVPLTYGKDTAWYDDGFLLRREDLEDLQEQTGFAFKGVYTPPFVDLSLEKNYGSTFAKRNQYAHYVPNLTGFAEFTEEDLADFGYTLIAGRLPDGVNDEIALSKYVFDSFVLSSYANYAGPVATIIDTGEVLSWDEYRIFHTADMQFSVALQQPESIVSQKIQSPEDLIEKTIFLGKRNYTITGIIDTHFDVSAYDGLTGKVSTEDPDRLDLNTLLTNGKFNCERNYSLHCAGFVGTGKLAEIEARYPSVLTVDTMTVSFQNQFYEISASTIAKLSDARNTNFLNNLFDENGMDIYTVYPPDTVPELDYRQILVNWFTFAVVHALDDDGTMTGLHPVEIYGDKIYKAYKMTVSYGDDQRIKAGSGWEVIGLHRDQLPYGDGYAIEDTIFVSDRLFDEISQGREGTYSFAVASLKESKSSIESMTFFCENNEGNRYPLLNAISFELNTLDDTLSGLAEIFRYAGLLFALFACFMFSNFISVSISARKRDIGIMRSLGARGRDVFYIFFTESLVIAAVNFLLSCGLSYSAAIIANLVMKSKFNLLLTIAHFGFRQVMILFILSFAVALLASIVPISRIARLKPVQAIRNT